MPKLSVVMPVWNRAYCIQDSVRSMIDQTFKDWELIIVDDGSDDSDLLVRKLQKFNDDRIKYNRTPHSGHISRVRNTGNYRANSDIIVVHDSDDMAFPDRLEEIYKVFQKDNPDVVYHGMYHRVYDPQNDAMARLIHPAQPFSKDRLLHEQYIPGQIAYKTEVIRKYPYDERIKVCDDWDMLIRLALNNCKFKMIDKQLYEYIEMLDSVNIHGEDDGRRAEDTKIIMDILEKEHGIQATAQMNKHTLTANFEKDKLIKKAHIFK